MSKSTKYSLILIVVLNVVEIAKGNVYDYWGELGLIIVAWVGGAIWAGYSNYKENSEKENKKNND